MEDVTARAWCFPSLGGISFPGIGFPGYSQDKSKNNRFKHTGYQVHWYIFPLMAWMGLFVDTVCLETEGFDLGYVTELDPSWNEDMISALLTPETILFANPIAAAVCAGECVEATLTGMADPKFFWCHGCQGTVYPNDGHISSEYGQVNGGLLAGERFAFKLHRMFLADGTMGQQAVCGNFSMPILDQRQYKFQMQNPSPGALISQFNCPSMGVSTLLQEPGKIVPVVGEDLSYIIFRKKNCCVL